VSVQSLFRALFVPGFILVMTALYWISLIGAPSSAQRVPRVIILFIVFMCVLVTLKEVKQLREVDDSEDISEPVLAAVKGWFIEHGQRVAFAIISIGYFPAFMWLGFNIANVVFLAMALPLAGLGSKLRPLPRIALSVTSALIAAVLFHLISLSMGFNVPAPFGI